METTINCRHCGSKNRVREHDGNETPVCGNCGKSLINRCPVIGIVGCYQNGKSTLVNCLLDDKVATTGSGKATTKLSTVFSYGEFQQAKAIESSTGIESILTFPEYLDGVIDGPCEYDSYHVSLWKPLLQNVDVLDTPGFYANEEDNRVATSSLDDLDVVVLVVRNKGLSEAEHSVLKTIAERELPFVVVMNCIETLGQLWNPASEANERIAQEIESRLRNIGHVPHPIDGRFVFPLNLVWFWLASGHLAYENDEIACRLRSKVTAYFKLEPVEHQTHQHIAETSNFLPFRYHLELLARHFGMLRRPEGERALKLMEQSQKFLREEELDQAMISAERACYVTQGFQPALYNRAAICLSRKEFEESIHAASRALAIDARDVDTLFLRAKTYFSQKEYYKARIDLLRITELLQSDWHIAWEDEDKAVQSRKLVEAYLMKMECDQRQGRTHDALKALRYIIDCDEQPMDNFDDAELHLIVWCLAAGLEYRKGAYERSINAAGLAMVFFTEVEEFPESLIGLSKWFELRDGDCSVGSGNMPLGDEIQRILWKACLAEENNTKNAVIIFVERNGLSISQTTWHEEPEFIPYFISVTGSDSEDFEDIGVFVEQYFNVSKDENLGGFVNIAKRGLKGRVLESFNKSVKLQCNITTSTTFIGNSVEITNIGNPVISKIRVNISYKLNDRCVQRTLQLPNSLEKFESHTWDNVFEGKSAFGVDWFGAKKLSHVKILSVNSEQGSIVVG